MARAIAEPVLTRRLDLVPAHDPAGIGNVAGDVEGVAAADEGHVLNLLAFEQRARLCGIEGDPAKRPVDSAQPVTQPVQLLQVSTVGGDQQGRHRSQWRSTSSRVERMLRALEAPKTIERTLGSEQTHSIASCGGIAPEAKTDIAIARKRRSRSASS